MFHIVSHISLVFPICLTEQSAMAFSVALEVTNRIGTPAKTSTSKYCIAKTDNCPVECSGATPKFCSSPTFKSDGSEDWETTADSCVAKGATCPCVGGLACSFFDSFMNESYSTCEAKISDGVNTD